MNDIFLGMRPELMELLWSRDVTVPHGLGVQLRHNFDEVWDVAGHFASVNSALVGLDLHEVSVVGLPEVGARAIVQAEVCLEHCCEELNRQQTTRPFLELYGNIPAPAF